MTDEVPDNEARLVLHDGPLVGPVLGRVVGMLAARAQCPIDRLDDALLLADAVAASGGDYTLNGSVGVHVLTTSRSLVMRVGPLRPNGARELLAAAELPGVGNVLERVADEVAPEVAEDGASERLRIRLDFG